MFLQQVLRKLPENEGAGRKAVGAVFHGIPPATHHHHAARQNHSLVSPGFTVFQVD